MSPKSSRPSEFIGAWPRLTRFYGVGPEHLQFWPTWLLRMYVEALPRLEAEEQLLMVQATVAPHTDEKEYKRMLDNLMDMADFPDEGPDLMSSAHRSKLESMGINVKVVHRDA